MVITLQVPLKFLVAFLFKMLIFKIFTIVAAIIKIALADAFNIGG
jgi:hypothetical protein